MHHFTKRELAIEELLLIILCLTLFGTIVLGAGAILPAKATLLNCGARAELEKSCRKDERCCVFLTGGTAALPPENLKEPVTPEDMIDTLSQQQNEDTGTIDIE